MRFTLRRANACDADAIANVYSASFRLLAFLPMLHNIEEYRWFIGNVILNECEVTVAEDHSGIVAFLARKGEEVRLLYTRPDRIGMGAGSQLIDAAKVHSNCGASRRMSAHDVFTKPDASARSVLPMVRTTRSRCPMSGIGWSLQRNDDHHWAVVCL